MKQFCAGVGQTRTFSEREPESPNEVPCFVLPPSQQNYSNWAWPTAGKAFVVSMNVRTMPFGDNTLHGVYPTPPPPPPYLQTGLT
jgi:hypothetical protein